MAKGNLLQGQARGKVGDVVFSRANGEQVSRVRNRNPKNPKTAKQMYQRAIMATVMQAYKAGQKIFDHSFQDQPKGAGNQRIFIRENAKILRKAIADALTAPDILQTTARTVAPSAVAPVPNEYLISRGTYENTQATVNNDPVNEDKVLFVGGYQNQPWAEFYANNDYREGDLYTIVFFTSESTNAYTTLDEDGNPDTLRTVKNSQFHFVRLRVKPIPNGNVPIVTMLGSFLEVTGSDLTFEATNVLNNEPLTFAIRNIVPSGTVVNCVGIIRSREDSNLRSTSYMTAPTVGNGYGLAANVVGEIWRKGAQSLGNSDLILEGGDDDAAPVPVPPSFPYRLKLRDGTITNVIPQNVNEVTQLEFETGKWICRGSVSDRLKQSGDWIMSDDVTNPDIVSTLRPNLSKIPSEAIAANMYYLHRALPAVKRYLEEINWAENLDMWMSFHEQEALCVSCMSKSSSLWAISNNDDVAEVSFSYIPSTFGFVWIIIE